MPAQLLPSQDQLLEAFAISGLTLANA